MANDPVKNRQQSKELSAIIAALGLMIWICAAGGWCIARIINYITS